MVLWNKWFDFYIVWNLDFSRSSWDYGNVDAVCLSVCARGHRHCNAHFNLAIREAHEKCHCMWSTLAHPVTSGLCQQFNQTESGLSRTYSINRNCMFHFAHCNSRLCLLVEYLAFKLDSKKAQILIKRKKERKNLTSTH